MDKLTAERRSANMRRIRSTGTRPELAVRRLVHGLGYRYRLHVSSLPGKPDLVFAKYKRVIEVRGCFWHQHPGCIDSHIPKSRRSYWVPKLAKNKRRDLWNEELLCAQGWATLVIWECEVLDLRSLTKRIRRFLK